MHGTRASPNIRGAPRIDCRDSAWRVRRARVPTHGRKSLSAHKVCCGADREQTVRQPLTEWDHMQPSKVDDEWSATFLRKTVRRRDVLIGAAALGPSMAAAQDADAVGFGARDLQQVMQSRVVYNPGSAVSGPSQLFYPDWMLGEWKVTTRFAAFDAPLGNRFVPRGALEAVKLPSENGGLGAVVGYQLRYYTAPKEEQGSLLGFGRGNPINAKTQVVADRAFNTKSTTDAFLGYPAVQRVAYDPRTKPTLQTVYFNELTPDMQPVKQKIELYINNRQGLYVTDAEYIASELFRQVTLGLRSVEVADYEIISQYRLLPDGTIRGRQRNLVYLQPQDDLYFDASNRAVAVYDYDLFLQRTSTGSCEQGPGPKETHCISLESLG